MSKRVLIEFDDYIDEAQKIKRDLMLRDFVLSGYDHDGNVVVFLSPQMNDSEVSYLIQVLKDRRDVIFNNHMDEF